LTAVKVGYTTMLSPEERLTCPSPR
jgi:hypothetical protein